MNIGRPKLRSHVKMGVLALAVALTSSLSAGAAAGAGRESAGGSAPLAHLVPAKIRAMGTITVPSSIEFPPFEYFAKNNTTAIGLDVDLMNGIGNLLGLKFKFVNYKFESIIPALQNGRFVISQSSFSDTSPREKQVDFVDYFVDGEQIMVKAGNPAHIHSYLDLCGKHVALAVGDTDISVAQTWSAKCKASGRPAISSSILPGTPQDLLAIQSGRADATITDAASGAYDVKTTHGAFAMVGPITDTGPYGIIFPKGSSQFEHAVQQALKYMAGHGTYGRILDKWAEHAGAIKSFTINGAKRYGV